MAQAVNPSPAALGSFTYGEEKRGRLNPLSIVVVVWFGMQHAGHARMACIDGMHDMHA